MDNLSIRCLRTSSDGRVRGFYELSKDKRGYFWELLDINENSVNHNNYPKIQKGIIRSVRGNYCAYFDFDEAEYLEAMKKCGNNSNS